MPQRSLDFAPGATTSDTCNTPATSKSGITTPLRPTSSATSHPAHGNPYREPSTFHAASCSPKGVHGSEDTDDEIDNPSRLLMHEDSGRTLRYFELRELETPTEDMPASLRETVQNSCNTIAQGEVPTPTSSSSRSKSTSTKPPARASCSTERSSIYVQ